MPTSFCKDMEAPLRRCVDKAMTAGATAARMVLHSNESSNCRFESGRLKTVGTNQTVGLSLDVVVDGRRGSASGNDLGAMESMVDTALALARVGSTAHFTAFPEPQEVVRVPRASEATRSLTREAMLEAGQTIVDRLKSQGSDLDIHAGASRHESESLLVTSGGVCHHEPRTHWSLHGHVQRTEGTDMLFAGYGRGWGELNDWFDPDLVVQRIEEDLANGATIADPIQGDLPIFIPREHTPMWLWPLNMGINGRSVAKDESPLKDRLGEQVLDPCMTLVDDPQRPYGAGAAVDDSGIPTRVTPLFTKGVLNGFLYDLDSAGLAGAEPTGHRGCSPWHARLEPGTTPSEALLADVDHGLVIKHLLGFGQSNIQNGDFSANVGLGYRVKNGRIVGRVKDTMIAGNIYDLFQANVRLSSDVDPISEAPAMLLTGAHVSAAGK